MTNAHCAPFPSSEEILNVFAQIGQGETLLLCGHLDVVPAQGPWSTPPFELVKREGVYFGRGCADMKGGIAAMVSAAHRFLSSGEYLKKGLALLFVADEEKDNLGMRHFLRQQIFLIAFFQAVRLFRMIRL